MSDNTLLLRQFAPWSIEQEWKCVSSRGKWCHAALPDVLLAAWGLYQKERALARETIPPLVVSVQWIWNRNDWHDDGDKSRERLPESNEESSPSGSMGSQLTGESQEGEEGKEEEDDEDTRTGGCYWGHVWSLYGRRPLGSRGGRRGRPGERV